MCHPLVTSCACAQTAFRSAVEANRRIWRGDRCSTDLWRCWLSIEVGQLSCNDRASRLYAYGSVAGSRPATRNPLSPYVVVSCWSRGRALDRRRVLTAAAPPAGWLIERRLKAGRVQSTIGFSQTSPPQRSVGFTAAVPQRPPLWGATYAGAAFVISMWICTRRSECCCWIAFPWWIYKHVVVAWRSCGDRTTATWRRMTSTTNCERLQQQHSPLAQRSDGQIPHQTSVLRGECGRGGACLKAPDARRQTELRSTAAHRNDYVTSFASGQSMCTAIHFLPINVRVNPQGWQFSTRLVHPLQPCHRWQKPSSRMWIVCMHAVKIRKSDKSYSSLMTAWYTSGAFAWKHIHWALGSLIHAHSHGLSARHRIKRVIHLTVSFIELPSQSLALKSTILKASHGVNSRAVFLFGCVL